MTYQVTPGTPKAQQALAFGRELQKACKARDVTLKELAHSQGISLTTLWNYRFGRSLPKLEKAATLAQALRWPKLRELVLKARTRTCQRAGCGVTFVNDVGSEARRYCSPACARIAGNVKQASMRARSAGQTGSHQARRAQIQRLRSGIRIADDRTRALSEAIASMCADCEPEGLCRTPLCPLRDYSPLPLAAHGEEDPRPHTALENRRASWTPERRRRQLEGNARRWARPGEKDRHRERMVALHAARTTDEQAAITAKAKATYTAARRSEVSTRVHAARRQVDAS